MKTLFFYVLLVTGGFLNVPARQMHACETANTRDFPSGCTVITLVKGDSVFFGGNDDYINPDSYYWVDPGDSSRYGVLWIGTPDNPQQGVNEKGLAYDANGLPRVDVDPHRERIPVPGGYADYVIQIMHECTTVEEVIDWVGKHQRHPYMHDQLHFADATGDAVIISAGKDGEMVFNRKARGDGFLVSTNFNVANPSNRYSYPCWRHDKASGMLEQLLKGNNAVTAIDVTNIMEAVHVEEASGWTIETMVADLVNGMVYIYFYYQYDHPLVLNIRNELANPRNPGPLSKLFPKEVREEAARRYDKAVLNITMNRIIGISWPVLVALSLFLLFLLRDRKGKSNRFWLPAVLVLGPVALLAGILSRRKSNDENCRNAIAETIGDLFPLVASYTLALTILILKMVSGGVSAAAQVIIMLVIPVALGLAFHAAFISSVSRGPAGRFALQRLPQVLVSAFLGLGGVILAAMPLVNKSLNMSLLIPLSPYPVITWWAIVVLGALPGGLFIFLFERWSVKRGFRAWTVLAGQEGDVRTPSWGRLWWWLPVSIAILFAGLIAGVMLAK